MTRPAEPLVLVSGFGPFEEVERNPSGEIALALAGDPPAGLRVRAAVLPVSFERAPRAWDETLGLAERPALCLGLGVAKRRGFRLEQRGSPVLKCVSRPDVDGRLAEEYSAPGPRLCSTIDLRRLLEGLRGRGVTDARISRTAGGYVCERIYHHILVRSEVRGAHGLFLHVPPLRFTPVERQIEVARWLLEELLSSGELAASARDQSSSSSRG